MAWSGWAADCVAGEPQPLDLGVGENALARVFFARPLHAGAGRGHDHVALAQPVEELGQVPVRAVGHDRPVVGDALDQLDDVAALDVVDNPAAPNRQRDVIEDVDGLPPTALAGLLLGVALDEVGGPLFDGVGRTRGPVFLGARPGLEL